MEPQLTDEEKIALDKKISQLKTIQTHHEDIRLLKKSDTEIISDLEGLKQGQEKLKIFVESEFENGRNKMKEHSLQIKVLDTKVERMGEKFEMSLSRFASDIISKIEAKEMAEVKAELRKKNDEEAKQEAKKWDLTKIIVAAVAGSFITYFISLLGTSKNIIGG